MRARRMTVAVGTALAMVSPALAGDKAQSTLVNPVVLTGAAVPALVPPIGAAWANGTSKGKTKGDDKCKIQVQLSTIALPDSDGVPGTGDEVICIADSQASVAYVAPLSVGAVLRGEILSGKVKIKADLFAEATGCVPSKGGGPGLAQYDGRITCYAPGGPYPPPPIPFISDPTQGVFPAGFAPRPPGALIATEGLNFAP